MNIGTPQREGEAEPLVEPLELPEPSSEPVPVSVPTSRG